MNPYVNIDLILSTESFLSEHKKMVEALKSRAISEYNAALKMPRKKKKKAKKSAQMLFSIACWGEI